MKATEKAPSKHVWKTLLKFLWRVKLPYLMILLTTVVALSRTQLALLIPNYMQQFYAGDFSTKIIAMLIITDILRYIVGSIAGWITRLCSAKVTRNIRKSLVGKLFRMPMAFYEENTPKSLISRTTEDTTKISNFVSSVLSDVISSAYGVIGVCVLLFDYGWQLSTVAVVLVPLTVLIFVICGKIDFKVNFLLQSKLAKLTKAIMERVLRLPLIKSTVNEDVEEKQGGDDIQEFYRAKLKFGVAVSGVSTLQKFGMYSCDLIVIIAGYFLSTSGVISADIFVAFYMFVTQFVAYIQMLLNSWSTAKGCQGAVLRIAQIFDEPAEQTAGEPVSNSDGTIRFRGVSFGYGGKPVLDHVTFTIPKRQLTAIVGRSGAGKSTLLKLIMGFYPVDSGDISVGGKPLADVDKRQWRRSIGYVSQDMQLFSGTIRENLVYGLDRQVSDQELHQALAMACADKFVSAFPRGLDEQVGVSGSNLSGGQGRRIMIAHALLQRTPYLLLDEVTSSLDVESKQAIDTAVRNIAAEKTVVMVSHDMAAVAAADHILVLDGGAVTGGGDHQEMLGQNPVYQKLQLAASAQ